MTPDPTLLFARVSDRLLREVPRFFSDFEVALAEVLQNCHRAEATEVNITYDEEARCLTIADNGPGLADPRGLLCAGDTGWDETRIVDPAGMGAFSLLRPEFVEEVVYTNHGSDDWRLTLTPEILTGAPAMLERISPNGGPGLTVAMQLAPKQRLDEAMIARARAFYPMAVRLNGEEIPPHREAQPTVAIDTPVGRLEWTLPPRYQGVGTPQAIWECRPIVSHSLSTALRDAAEGGPHARRNPTRPFHELLARRLLSAGSIRWFIDPACGVRPKLPDRSELIRDQHLDTAARELVETLIQHVEERTRVASEGWSDRLSHNSYPPGDVPWLEDEGVRLAVLPHLGWHRLCFRSLERLEAYYTADDGPEIEYYITVAYDRSAVPVGDPTLAFALHVLGHNVAYVHRAPVPAVRIEGLRVPPRDTQPASLLALAEGIHVEGFGLLPYLLVDPMEAGVDAFLGCGALPPGVCVHAIFAGDVDAFCRFVNTTAAEPFLNAVILSEEHVNQIRIWDSREDWPDPDRPTIDEQRVIDALVMSVTAAFARELLPARQEYAATLKLAARLRDLADPVEHFRFKQPDPEHLRDQVADRLEQAQASVWAAILAAARNLPDLAEQARCDLPDWVTRLLAQEGVVPGSNVEDATAHDAD